MTYREVFQLALVAVGFGALGRYTPELAVGLLAAVCYLLVLVRLAVELVLVGLAVERDMAKAAVDDGNLRGRPVPGELPETVAKKEAGA